MDLSTAVTSAKNLVTQLGTESSELRKGDGLQLKPAHSVEMWLRKAIAAYEFQCILDIARSNGTSFRIMVCLIVPDQLF